MISVRGLSLRFEGFRLDDINLDIEEGCFFIVMGPTGAGKTVLLEAIAGHHALDSGSVSLRGVDVTRLPPEARRVGIVYQDYALFPHLNVERNIRFAEAYLGDDEADARGLRFRRLVERLDIGHLLGRKPGTLSGGESQRVALARALLPDPDLVLLDEPLSALDPAFRGELRDMLKDIHRDTGTTFVAVTHDFDEARDLGTRGAVMNRGRIVQDGSIADIFERPNDEFVARFVGASARARQS
ncbi:MAG TPA: ATP-binding cassette domain-containing protein [Spirochaetales bacterium]|nr:ATP-binding cassette domain-containing protein [Spirochaetia bacterium]HPE36628.1 ATP-binding cassette domain-containing protein [Spirochaetales bacterium]